MLPSVVVGSAVVVVGAPVVVGLGVLVLVVGVVVSRSGRMENWSYIIFCFWILKHVLN